MEFKNYLSKFAKNTNDVQTHLSFNKGKYNIPSKEYETFCRKYFNEVNIGNKELYLIEKIFERNFPFFIDIDTSEKVENPDENTMEIMNRIDDIIKEMYSTTEETEVVVTKRDNKYHLNYPKLIVNSEIANAICEKLDDESVDKSVYRTGLRMVGSRKNEKDNVYKVYDIEKGEYKELDYEMFKKTVLKSSLTNKLTGKLKKPLKVKDLPTKKKVIGITDGKIENEIELLLGECETSYELKVSRIFCKKNETGMFYYFVGIEDKHCPFKDREHKRETSPLYVEIGMKGMYIKCHDSDCARNKLEIQPKEGWEDRYNQLYTSMSPKYCEPKVELTRETRKVIEESLIGSHYQVAKAAFTIYKDKYRVDDIKNTTWYEFEERWKKSHTINIVLSEELVKYYNSVKVVKHNDGGSDEKLDEYLSKDDAAPSKKKDERNELVNSVIAKLENVTFKNSVMNQITHLYKAYDPDFYTRLDSNPYLIGFENGVYDFVGNIFRKSKREDYITFSTGYDYVEYNEENKEVTEIYKFLKKIIPNDKVREYLLKVLGKSLIGLPDEKFYVWSGITGANGKSTLVNFLEETLGEYITSVDVSLLTNKRGMSGNASPDVVRLRGRRLLTFQEPEHDDKLRTGILKQYTGGDTIIARELFKAPITFKLQGTMLMCCNDLPAVTSIDGGTWRRIRVIDFRSRFCENPVKSNEFKIDKDIKKKIQIWKPYFMSILINWYKKYLEEGMKEPEEVTKATAKYKVDNDRCNEFFDQCLEESEKFESIKTIYTRFQQWWINNYTNTKVPDIRELKRALKIKYGLEKEKKIQGVMYYGFNVKINYEDNYEDFTED